MLAFDSTATFPDNLYNGRRTAHITRACNRCREKKSKCDGCERCASCVQADVNCIYTSQFDRRRAFTKQEVIQANGSIKLLEERLGQIEERIIQLEGRFVKSSAEGDAQLLGGRGDSVNTIASAADTQGVRMLSHPVISTAQSEEPFDPQYSHVLDRNLLTAIEPSPAQQIFFQVVPGRLRHQAEVYNDVVFPADGFPYRNTQDGLGRLNLPVPAFDAGLHALQGAANNVHIYRSDTQ